MSNGSKKTHISDEVMHFLNGELKDVDSNKAKLLLYNMLLDKYSVPENDSLRSDTHHHLSLDDLSKLLIARGYSRTIQ